MKAKWKDIPKDSYGFFDEESDLYKRLPIIVSEIYDDGFMSLYYVDEENWTDIISDLSKERFKYYIEVEKVN